MHGKAQAACTPPSTASNATVECSGDTVNSGPDNITGYGTNNDDNNTYTIQAGATVTGTSFGLRIGTGATINNFGTILGSLAVGIGGTNGTVTLNNASTGIISGNNGITVDRFTLNNAGQILGIGANGGAIIASTASVITPAQAPSQALCSASTSIISVSTAPARSRQRIDRRWHLQHFRCRHEHKQRHHHGRSQRNPGEAIATVSNAGNISGGTGSGIVADTAEVTNISSGVISGDIASARPLPPVSTTPVRLPAWRTGSSPIP